MEQPLINPPIRSLAEECQLAIKYLRVMRAIVRSYRRANPEGEIEHEFMTPYERGRLQRTADKLSDALCEISKTHKHHRIAFFFLTYIEGLGLNRSLFGVKRSSNWNFIGSCQDIVLQDEFMTGEFMAPRILAVAQMLDLPMSQIPGRIMLLKLGLPIQ